MQEGPPPLLLARQHPLFLARSAHAHLPHAQLRHAGLGREDVPRRVLGVAAGAKRGIRLRKPSPLVSPRGEQDTDSRSAKETRPLSELRARPCGACCPAWPFARRPRPRRSLQLNPHKYASPHKHLHQQAATLACRPHWLYSFPPQAYTWPSSDSARQCQPPMAACVRVWQHMGGEEGGVRRWLQERAVMRLIPVMKVATGGHNQATCPGSCSAAQRSLPPISCQAQPLARHCTMRAPLSPCQRHGVHPIANAAAVALLQCLHPQTQTCSPPQTHKLHAPARCGPP